MTERLTDEQLRALQQSVRTDTLPQILAVQTAVAELLALRARVAKLEAALTSIASTYDESWRIGSQERRIGDEARAALKDAPQ